MPQKCPNCESYTLSYDPVRRTARCYRLDCDFEQRVKDEDEYYNKFVLIKRNWSNYCASTPLFVRKIRGTLKPVDDN
jgi:hypothetical protein